MGRVARAHGLNGELRVAAFASGAPNLQPGRRLLLGGVDVRIDSARPSGDAWILSVDAIRDRTTAERFRGQLFEAPDGEVERDSSDSYFIHELIGLRVQTADGEDLGTITEVLQPGAERRLCCPRSARRSIGACNRRCGHFNRPTGRCHDHYTSCGIVRRIRIVH